MGTQFPDIRHPTGCQIDLISPSNIEALSLIQQPGFYSSFVSAYLVFGIAPINSSCSVLVACLAERPPELKEIVLVWQSVASGGISLWQRL